MQEGHVGTGTQYQSLHSLQWSQGSVPLSINRAKNAEPVIRSLICYFTHMIYNSLCNFFTEEYDFKGGKMRSIDLKIDNVQFI